MVNWELISVALIFLFFSLALIEFCGMIYHQVKNQNQDKKRKSALEIYNKRELEFIHDGIKWAKWKEQNPNICKIIRGTYF